MESLEKAIQIVTKEFAGVIDKGGNPYILHCLAVMEGVEYLGPSVMCAAVLHDLVEDTDWTEEALRKEGFPEDIIEMILICTKKKDDEYFDYIERVSKKPETRAIKISDLRHNMKIERLKELDDKAIERIKKYHKAYRLLLSVEG
ncbi:MAG TPA: HD domain-containing protein [Treponemataceae bacterium]|nr:HD domain-containing protein [Treponemataceae bacterium]